jgi:hypothetical protein
MNPNFSMLQTEAIITHYKNKEVAHRKKTLNGQEHEDWSGCDPVPEISL